MADVGSALWWLERLDEQRRARNTHLSVLQRYATGQHPLPESSRRWRDYYRAWQRRSRTNYCGLIASSVSERMTVDGFRTDDAGLDSQVWRWWNASRMNADADLVHGAAADLGYGYVIVGETATAESPMQVIAEHDPMDRRRPVAAMKTWTDDMALEEMQRSIVYLPDRVALFEAKRPDWVDELHPLTWVQVDEQPNPIGEVPVVEFVNRPRLGGMGMSEFADVIDVQDRINSLQLHLLTIAQSQAFRQRYVKGLATEDENGNPLDPPFEALVSALWVVDDPDVEFGEFQQVDLRPLLEALRESVTQLVSVSGLPPHYVAGDLVNASADALAAAEARLVSKVRARQRVAGEAWERVIRLLGLWQGVDVPDTIEVRWQDPERKTDAQLADAVLKSAQFGVPWEQRMIDRGYSPQQIDRMRDQRRQEAEFDAQGAALTARAAIAGDLGF